MKKPREKGPNPRAHEDVTLNTPPTRRRRPMQTPDGGDCWKERILLIFILRQQTILVKRKW